MNSKNGFEDDILSQSMVYEEILGKFIKPNQPYTVLDFPNYSNIGDSLIYLGQLSFFEKNAQQAPSVVADCKADIGELLLQIPKGPIFIQGGGNFGDLWPNHQHFRLKLLENFKEHEIIQLPQSIHFSDVKNIAKTAKAISEHGNFTLAVRDNESLKFVKQHFDCPVYLAPDAACMLLDHIVYRNRPTIECLAMLRGDKERKCLEVMEYLPEGTVIEDWEDIQVWRLRERIFKKVFITSMPLRKIAMLSTKLLFKHQATRRFKGGMAQLARAKMVITDRLHVHLLCCLMGKPHVVIDNSYGKLSGYVGAWENAQKTFFVNQIEQIPDAVAAAYQSLT